MLQSFGGLVLWIYHDRADLQRECGDAANDASLPAMPNGCHHCHAEAELGKQMFWDFRYYLKKKIIAVGHALSVHDERIFVI